MPFKYLQQDELLVTSNSIKNGDSFLVKDGKLAFPFEIQIVDETPEAIKVREVSDPQNSLWILREDLENHYELISVLRDDK